MRKLKNAWFSFKCKIAPYLGYKNSDEEYPELNSLVKVIGMREKARYVLPSEFPPFAETERDKRMWYQFVFPDDSFLNASSIWWKDS